MSALTNILAIPGIPWFAQIDGSDIVVRKVVITAFGGDQDTGDDGQTASGEINDGSNPSLLGCALPILTTVPNTAHSPLAFKVHIPWRTKVRFWQGSDESNFIETVLIDNGPDVQDYPTHAGDLTVFAALQFAPKLPLARIANDFETILSYRIMNGASLLKLI